MNPTWCGRGRASRGRGRGWRGGGPPRGGGSRRGGGLCLFQQQHTDYLNVRGRRGNYHGPPEHFNQMYPSHSSEPPSWAHFRDRTPYNHGLLPDYTSQQGPHHRRPFLSPPHFHQSPVRPSSPLPGSEEYMQRDISEKSAFLKRQLELEEPSTVDNNLSTNNTFVQSICDYIGDDFATDTASENFCDNPFAQNKSDNVDTCSTDVQNKCDEQTVTKSVASPRRNKKPVKRQKQQEEMLSVEEIHNKIINHIANLSHEKKMNFLNQSGPSGYDIAVQQITRQKRLELSKALRDMCKDKFKESENTSQVIQAIIPDFDIKIEELPREVVEQLSTTLDEDFEGHVQNISVDPELMFQQAANMLNTMLDLEDAGKGNFNFAEGENTLDNSNFEYPILQNINTEEKDSSGNVLQNPKDSNYMKTMPSDTVQIHSSGTNTSYNKTVVSTSTINYDNISTSCKLSPGSFSPSLSVSFPTPPPVMYGVPPPPQTLLECQPPDIEELSFPNSLISPDDNFDSMEQANKSQYYSPGDVSSENSLPPTTTFSETQYYSPGNTSESSLPATSVFGDLPMKQNISKSNYVDQPSLSSSLNIDQVNHILQSSSHPFNPIENQTSKQSFDLNAAVNNNLMQTNELEYGSLPKQDFVERTQEYFPLSTTEVSNILLPPPNPPPTLQKSCIESSVKEEEAIILSNIRVPSPSFTYKNHNQNSQSSDVLTEAAELEACLAQSGAEFSYLGMNISKNNSSSCDIPSQNNKLLTDNSEDKSKASQIEPLLKIRTDISAIRTLNELNEKTNELVGKRTDDKEDLKETKEGKTLMDKSEIIDHRELNSENAGEENCSKTEINKNNKENVEERSNRKDKLIESTTADNLQHTVSNTEKCKEEHVTVKKAKSRSKSKEKDENSKSSKSKKKTMDEKTSEEKNKEKGSRSQLNDEHTASTEAYSQRFQRSRYDLHQFQKFEEEYRRKTMSDEDRYRRSDRDRSNSEDSESHHHGGKYQMERDDTRHTKRYYHDSYPYRNEYPEYKSDYFNPQKYDYASEYYAQSESRYVPESFDPNSNHSSSQKCRSKREKQSKKRSKKRKKRRNRSACSFTSISSSERHSSLSSHKRNKHKSKHVDSLNADEKSPHKSNLKPLKERIQILCEFKYNRKRESSLSDYEVDRKIKSEPISPDISKEPSPERCRSIEKINFKKEFDANDLRQALNNKFLSRIPCTNSRVAMDKSCSEKINVENPQGEKESQQNKPCSSHENATETTLGSEKHGKLQSATGKTTTNSTNSSVTLLDDNTKNQESDSNDKSKSLESKKPDHRPWKSPGEKKFMMEHLQNNPQSDESDVKVSKMNIDSDSSGQSNDNAMKIKDDVPDESALRNTDKLEVESVLEKSNSKSLSKVSKKDGFDKSNSTVEIKSGQSQFETVPQGSSSVEICLPEKSVEVSSMSLQNNELKIKETDTTHQSKLSLDNIDSEKIDSSVQKSYDVETTTPSESTHLISNSIELPTTSCKVDELTLNVPEENSRLTIESNAKSEDLKTSSNKYSKNGRNKTRSHSKTKETEILHSAEVSSTSDATTKFTKKSTAIVETISKSKSRSKHSALLPLKEETLDFPRSEVNTPVEFKSVDSPITSKVDISITKERMFVTTYTQTEMSIEDDKDESHKKDLKKDKKHSSNKSDRHKLPKCVTVCVQTNTINVNVSTQTQNTRCKNAQVQIDLGNPKSSSKRSNHVQTDPVVIFENIEEIDDFNDKSKNLDKSHRKILKAVRRRKTIERMLDLDKEIERLTKMRQNLYKILNVNSDSDSDDCSENHTIKTNADKHSKDSDTSSKDKHCHISARSKLDSNRKDSKVKSNKKSSTDIEKNRTSLTPDLVDNHTSNKKSRLRKTRKEHSDKETATVAEEISSEKYKEEKGSNEENFETEVSSKDANETKVSSTRNDKSSDIKLNKQTSKIEKDIEDTNSSDNCGTNISTKAQLKQLVQGTNESGETNIAENLANNKQLNIGKIETNTKSDKLILKIKGYNTVKQNQINLENIKTEPSKDIQLSEESELDETVRSTRSRNKKHSSPTPQDAIEEKTESRRRQRRKTEPEVITETNSTNDKNDEVASTKNETSKKRRRRKTEIGNSNEKEKSIDENQYSKSQQKFDECVPSNKSAENKNTLKVVLKPKSLKRKLETPKEDEVSSKRNKVPTQLEDEDCTINELNKKAVNNEKSSSNLDSDTGSKLRKRERIKEGNKSSTRKLKNSQYKVPDAEEKATCEDSQISTTEHTDQQLNAQEITSPDNSTSQENENVSTQKDDAQSETAPPPEIFSIEQNEGSNKLKENLAEESKPIEQSRKRKRTDLVELDSTADALNILQTKKTKKSKPISESPIDKEGGSPKKKKKYPFSGVKSGYTRTKRRKSSSDTSSKGSPVLRNKVLNEIPKDDSFGCDIKSSIVKLTRYSISELEKIKEELLKKSDIKEEESKFCNLQSPEEIDLLGKNFTCKLGASPDSYDVKIVSVKPSHVLSKSPSLEDIRTISGNTSVKDESSSVQNSDRPSTLKTSDNAKSKSRHNKKDISETCFKNTVDDHKDNEDKSESVEVEDNNDVRIVDQYNVETVHKEEEYKMDFGRFTGAILVIRVVDSTIISASDKGKVFYFNMLNGDLTNTVDVSKFAITSMIVTRKNDTNLIYTGSLDSCINVLNFHNGEIIKIENISEPVQCMENAWHYVFIGSDRGSLIRYNLNSEKVEDTIKISDTNVLVMKATQEGPRKVLVVATRNAAVSVRDALSGLLLRTLETPFFPTVYTLLFDRNLIYCGTSQHDILVYTFEDGQLVFKHEATRSKGVVCMRIVGSLLFAGCYNGNIYVYNTKTNVHLGTMNGPGGLMLSMEIVDNKIIVGTKSSNFRAWRIPQKYLDQM